MKFTTQQLRLWMMSDKQTNSLSIYCFTACAQCPPHCWMHDLRWTPLLVGQSMVFNDLLVKLLPLFNQMSWRDWRHECVCDTPAAPVRSTLYWSVQHDWLWKSLWRHSHCSNHCPVKNSSIYSGSRRSFICSSNSMSHSGCGASHQGSNKGFNKSLRPLSSSRCDSINREIQKTAQKAGSQKNISYQMTVNLLANSIC